MDTFVLNQILKEFPFRKEQIQNTVALLEEGNTIPFIARYRKEWTGQLDEVQLRQIKDRYDYLVDLQARKSVILNSIREQDKLTPELQERIESCLVKQDLEDLYLPYKPKRRTKATAAREKGLGPLADIIMVQDIVDGSLDEIARPFLDEEKGVLSIEQAYEGAGYICAEMIADMADLRKFVREVFMKKGEIVSQAKAGYENEPTKYTMYYDYREPVDKIASHRLLAIRRGDKEEILAANIVVTVDEVLEGINIRVIKNANSIFFPLLCGYIEDAYKRLIAESIEKQVWQALKERSDEPAISIFAKNLKNVLLVPPIPGKTVMGIDPGQRTGCKVAVIDSTGKYLYSATIYPHPPVNKKGEAMALMLDMIDNYGVEYISIGNGTASRETDIFVKELLAERAKDGSAWEVKAVVVNESGASIYSASDIAREEFPDLDLTVRGAISIARRLQDPLAELVKIEPKSIGVGQYQHDVDQKSLKQALDAVVESCVNFVGVDLNTASSSLLQYVSGIGPQLAKQIVAYREENGAFRSRNQLKKVPRFGAKAFEQSAGFLRIRDGEQPLDNSAVHPESYPIVQAMCQDLGVEITGLIGNNDLLDGIDPNKYITEKAGLPTVLDIIEELRKPGRDPRQEIKTPKFREDVMKMEDLKPGMMIEGVVTNLTNFGAFVDIGVHQDGLVHVSQMGKKFVKDPSAVCSVGDVVRVKVLSVDIERKRIGLSMKDGS
ncbi:RNA-binding transcriptional accessory protein [bacterium]|nr:RNA-binding transcriptional accessory protein [bacterium]